MRKFRPSFFLGVGVLTPALTGIPHPAAARSYEADRNIDTAEAPSAPRSARETARAHLASVVLGLSPMAKRKLAGDRVRLPSDLVGPHPLRLVSLGNPIYAPTPRCGTAPARHKIHPTQFCFGPTYHATCGSNIMHCGWVPPIGKEPVITRPVIVRPNISLPHVR